MRNANSRTIWVLPAIVAASSVLSTSARADVTFVCNDGSIVTVLPGQLEAMKRSDPCVASHFGVTVTAQSAAGPAVSLAPTDAPLPERKPADDVIADKLRALENPDALASSTRETKTDVAGVPRDAAASSAPSDFRNVYILNAPAGGQRYFRHTR